jgi:hypothetical protein
VVAFFYYSGHGEMRQDKKTGYWNTFMVHGDGDATNIEAALIDLALEPNVQVFALLDCCRTRVAGKGAGTIKPLKGNICIGFGVQADKTARQVGKELSQYTKGFLDHINEKESLCLPKDMMGAAFAARGELKSVAVDRNFDLTMNGRGPA